LRVGKGEAIATRDEQAATRHFYRPELDVVRFIAFLLVFLHHTLPYGNDLRVDHLWGKFAPVFYAATRACVFGVSLFFTLSAFLICELLLRERKMAETVCVKQFYIRRMLRIWPLYYLALALGVLVVFLPGGNHKSLAPISWFVVFLGAQRTALWGFLDSPIAPLWSVSVEEQFYLLAPWAIKFLNRKLLYGGCAALILLLNVWLFHLGHIRVDFARVWGDPLIQFECFAAGILLCLFLGSRLPMLGISRRLALVVGWACCWMTATYGLHIRFYHAYDDPGGWHLIAGYALVALGSVCMIVAFLGVDPRSLPAWMVYLGRISYGLYVYHGFALNITNRFPLSTLLINRIPNYPLRVCLTAALTIGCPLALTLLMATVSYRYIEAPFLKLKRRHTIVDSQPVPVAL
jgi:peptidoglycan/LPS O-acetylase OafA/YrhL